MAECKWCKADIEWEQADGRWKAYDPTGRVHWCEERKQGQAGKVAKSTDADKRREKLTQTAPVEESETVYLLREILKALNGLTEAVDRLSIAPYLPNKEEAPLSKPLPWREPTMY